MTIRLSDAERRLGVREVRPAPGDGRDFPSESYRLPTREEKLRAIPNAGGRERAKLGVYHDSPEALKRLADRVVHLKQKLRAKLDGDER